MPASSDKTGNSGAKDPESNQISPLGQAIRYFREEQRMTQEALAEATSEDERKRVDKQRISDIERGATRGLHPKTLMKLCDGLGITLDGLKAKEREFARAGKAQDTRKPPAPSSAGQASIIHNDIRPVPGFTGREDLLAGIDAALWDKGGGTAALTNDATSAAVKGLGGVGKSVLAREYAWRARGRYHGVWWVRAETEQTLIDGCVGNFVFRAIEMLKKETSHGTTQTPGYPGRRS